MNWMIHWIIPFYFNWEEEIRHVQFLSKNIWDLFEATSHCCGKTISREHFPMLPENLCFPQKNDIVESSWYFLAIWNNRLEDFSQLVAKHVETNISYSNQLLNPVGEPIIHCLTSNWHLQLYRCFGSFQKGGMTRWSTTKRGCKTMFLVGGSNPSEKYACQNWESSPNRGEDKNIWNHHLGFVFGTFFWVRVSEGESSTRLKPPSSGVFISSWKLGLIGRYRLSALPLGKNLGKPAGKCPIL